MKKKRERRRRRERKVKIQRKTPVLVEIQHRCSRPLNEVEKEVFGMAIRA